VLPVGRASARRDAACRAEARPTSH
jgi:hypothetical protein